MLGDQLRCRHDIVVDEQDEVAGGMPHATITRHRYPLVWLHHRVEL